MSITTFTATAKCRSCKSHITWETDTVTDDTILVCPDCGLEAGTYGKFKFDATLAARDEAAQFLADGLKDIFKR